MPDEIRYPAVEEEQHHLHLPQRSRAVIPILVDAEGQLQETQKELKLPRSEHVGGEPGPRQYTVKHSLK